VPSSCPPAFAHLEDLRCGQPDRGAHGQIPIPQSRKAARVVRQSLLEQPAERGEAITRKIHGGFYCTRRYAAPTRWPPIPRGQLGGLSARSVNVLFQGRLPPSRLLAPVSPGVSAVSLRTPMNPAGSGDRLSSGLSPFHFYFWGRFNSYEPAAWSPLTARIEGAHSDRAPSASKGGDQPAGSLSSSDSARFPIAWADNDDAL
jgi:hypothetical protein